MNSTELWLCRYLSGLFLSMLELPVDLRLSGIATLLLNLSVLHRRTSCVDLGVSYRSTDGTGASPSMVSSSSPGRTTHRVITFSLRPGCRKMVTGRAVAFQAETPRSDTTLATRQC